MVVIIIGALLVSVQPSFSQTAPSEVWVNWAWAGSAEGAVVDAQGHVFGVDATDTISNGSGMVADGGTVYVAAGTYNENVVLDKPLTLRGSNAGVPANGARQDESIINGSSGTGISITTGEVTVDGFTITGFTQQINAAGDDLTIANNVIDAGYMTYPVYGTGDRATFVDNNIYWLGGMEAFVWYGDDANISYNVISVPPDFGASISATPDGGFLFCEGDNSVISDNVIGGYEWSTPGEGIQAIGDHAAISGNSVTIGSTTYLIKVEGDWASVIDNDLNADVVTNAAITITGDNGSVGENAIQSDRIMSAIIYYDGEFGTVDQNTLTAEYCDDEGIWYWGSNATITGNTFDLGSLDCDVIDYDGYGDYTVGATITGNTINADYVDSHVVSYEGPAGAVDGNQIDVDEIGDEVIDYSAYAYGDSDDAGTVSDNHIVVGEASAGILFNADTYGPLVAGPMGNAVGEVSGNDISAGYFEDVEEFDGPGDLQNAAIIYLGNEGVVSDNTVEVDDYCDCVIYYYGDAGRVTDNTDLSDHSYVWPMVVYYGNDDSLLPLGHGVITGNSGGSIFYYAGPHATISDNIVKTVIPFGIYTEFAEFNAIERNDITAPVGIFTSGTLGTIKDNVIETNYFVPVAEDMGMTAGIVFDGDQNTVTGNTIKNATAGIVNIGVFMNDDLLDMRGTVDAQYTDDVNTTVAQVMKEVAGLKQDLGASTSAIASRTMTVKANEGHGEDLVIGGAVKAQDSGLGYRGYGNVISDNSLENNDTYSLVGIVTLGYDFVVDSNKFVNQDYSETLAGIVTGGDGGQVTDNELSNISMLGIFYGGLFKFDSGLQRNDIMGMNALISGNTLDNTEYYSSPIGIVFMGYDAGIDENELLGVGLGILSIQATGTMADNAIDGYHDLDYKAGAADEGMGPMGFIGTATLCDNLTYTGNSLANMSRASIFIPFDPYTTYGNAYIAGNTYSDNWIQMAFMPGFQPEMGDTAAELNTGSLVDLLHANTLDRVVYDTDANGDLFPIYGQAFGMPWYVVFGEIQPAVMGSYYGMPYATVNVWPGYYPLYEPISVPPMLQDLTILGSPQAPYSTIVDTGTIPYYEPEEVTPVSTSPYGPLDRNAFEVFANNVTINGFKIENSNNTFEDMDYGMNYGIAVGYIPDAVPTSQPPLYVAGGLFTNNVLQDLTAGIYLGHCEDAVIQGNKFTGNNMGVYLSEYCYANSTEIHYNDIAGNYAFGVNNMDFLYNPDVQGSSAESLWVNATYNWWGSSEGPYDVTVFPDPTTTGDKVTYYVLYEPWLTKPVFSSQYTYNLVPGWNLISVPLDVPDTDLDEFFPADVKSGITEMWGWDESAQDWVFYGPDANDWFYTQYPALTGVETGRAYWVKMTAPAGFTIEGTVPDSAPESPVALVEGWNFIGTTGLASSTPEELYTSSPEVWGWDESAQDWLFYGYDENDWFYTQYPALEELEAGHGHWVKVVAV